MKRERDGERAGVHQPFKFSRAADAADEVDALVGAHIVDAKQWRKHRVLQATHVEGGLGRQPRGRRAEIKG
jgi:hypothetical protein